MDEHHPNWKLQLQADLRGRLIKRIMDTLIQHLPVTVPEGILELSKIAVRVDEKVYASAVSKSDYFRKISLKMLTVERTQNNINGMANPLPHDPPNPDMDDTRWKTQLRNCYRKRIITKILDTSMRHLPPRGPAEFLEATESVIRIEENIYTTATTQSDYLHRISLKMLSMEVNSENSNIYDDDDDDDIVAQFFGPDRT